eukprot:scaffold44361_cov57-Phaeocystis_antarctica.AAC.2
MSTTPPWAAVIDNNKLWGNVSKRQSTRTLGIRFEGSSKVARRRRQSLRYCRLRAVHARESECVELCACMYTLY